MFKLIVVFIKVIRKYDKKRLLNLSIHIYIGPAVSFIFRVLKTLAIRLRIKVGLLKVFGISCVYNVKIG